MGGGRVNLYLTDPPYNVAYEGKTKDALTIENDSMEDGAFRQFLVDAFSMADTVLEPGGVFYIWHADSEGYNFRGACRDVGWKVRECLIWNKNAFVAAEQTGRIAYLMELDPVYVDVIIKRWQEMTGLEAVRDDGKTYNSLI